VKDEVGIQSMCGHNPFIVNCPFFWQSRKQLFIGRRNRKSFKILQSSKCCITWELTELQYCAQKRKQMIDVNISVLTVGLTPAVLICFQKVCRIQLIVVSCKYWCPYSGVFEDSSLLRCYAMLTGK